MRGGPAQGLCGRRSAIRRLVPHGGGTPNGVRDQRESSRGPEIMDGPSRIVLPSNLTFTFISKETVRRVGKLDKFTVASLS